MQRVDQWCPSCFRAGAAVPAVADLPSYLAVLDRMYQSSAFTIHTSLDFEGQPPAFDDEMRRTIERVPYLRAMLGHHLRTSP